MIVLLAGGLGAARFLQGLVRVVEPKDITVIVNTGDDVELHGLYISPDVDTITYTLAGLLDEARGWGVIGDTFHGLRVLKMLGHETWFNLGDRDLALHIHRTRLMRQGKTLSEVTASVTDSLDIATKVLPMSNDRVETRIVTNTGTLGFQEYLVKRGATDRVKAIEFVGIEAAQPPPGVIKALMDAQAIILAPSNPLISIGPILAIAGVRDALKETRAGIAAISPIVGGEALKGPAAGMMKDLGHEVSAYGVAKLYRDFLDIFVLDQVDDDQASQVEGLGIKAVPINTIMTGMEKKEALARTTLRALEVKNV